MINEPYYAEDLVNLGYLNTRLEGTNKLLLSKTQNYGSQPIPPYRVNDTYMNGIDIYICVNERLIGDFNASDWEKASNYTDNTLAESKNKVFNVQPIPPYKVGDLWTSGPNGELRRCVFTRLVGVFQESDWENATKYDSTQTTVEGGLVTTGTIQVVQGGTVAAGMTGNTSGDTAVRFWAGKTFANRNTAPFRVTQAGAVNASNIAITGGSLSVGGKFEVTSAGILTATDVNLTGAITATSGTIGGWSISGTQLLNNKTNFAVYLNAPSSYGGPGGAADVLVVNDKTNGTYPVVITSNGTAQFTKLLAYNGVGFANLGLSSYHPWFSGVNINRNNGIVFRTGTTNGAVGDPVGQIDMANNFIQTSTGLKVNGNLTVTDYYNAISGYNIDIVNSYNDVNVQGYHVNLRAREGYVYAARASGSFSRVAVDGSGPSSLCLKKNVKLMKKSDEDLAIDILRKIDLYRYDYKYNISNNKNEFGFVIDYIKELPNVDKFFYFHKEKAKVVHNELDYKEGFEHPYDEDTINFERFDIETLCKYLLVVCKSQQEQIDEIKGGKYYG